MKYNLAVDQTTTGPSVNLFVATQPQRGEMNSRGTVQVSGITSSGTGSATVLVEVSNNGSDYLTDGTIALTLSTTSASAAHILSANYEYIRTNVTAISGTGANISSVMGI